jgi:beta-carotene 3-hydroxylase
MIWTLVLITTFIAMEGVAWFSHKYIMHGFLWNLHKDHHKKDHNSWFERNDFFFVFYAIVSAVFMILWGEYNFWPGFPIALGIFLYGLTYFFVHDIFIHQRFKWFRNANNRYARGIRRAHKIHHKHLNKEKGECFGMLWVPPKYFK